MAPAAQTTYRNHNLGDFIGECVACGCFVEEEHDEGAGYTHSIEEKYLIFGRFASLDDQDQFRQAAWEWDYLELKTEAPFFFTLRALPISMGGTDVFLSCRHGLPDRIRRRVLYEQDSQGLWTFPIHECCLEILDQFIAWSKLATSPSPDLRSREHFYDLVCLQQERNLRLHAPDPESDRLVHPGVVWEYAYFGAQQSWKNYNGNHRASGPGYSGQV